MSMPSPPPSPASPEPSAKVRENTRLTLIPSPADAAWLSWYFLGEQMNARGLLGSAIILAAVVIGAIAPEVEKIVESIESPAAS